MFKIINYFQQLSKHDKQMVRYTMRCKATEMLKEKKHLINKQKKLPRNRKIDSRAYKYWNGVYTKQSMYLRSLSFKMSTPSFNPNAKQTTNMWVCLRYYQRNLKEIANYDATTALNILMKQLKTRDSHNSSSKHINTNSLSNNSIQRKNIPNQAIINSKNYILIFIQKHFNHLNCNQIMRGVYKWSKQNYHKTTYFNKLLPNNFHVLSMNYISKSCQQAINKTLKNNQLNESVKITNVLNGIKKFHSNYFVLNNDNLLPLDKKLCSKIIGYLLN